MWLKQGQEKEKKKSIEHFPGYYLCFWKETINNMLTVSMLTSSCLFKVHSRVSWKDVSLYIASPEREFAKISKPDLRLWTKAFPPHFKYSYLILDWEAKAETPAKILLLVKGNVGQWMSYWSENRFKEKTLQDVFVSLRTVGAILSELLWPSTVMGNTAVHILQFSL